MALTAEEEAKVKQIITAYDNGKKTQKMGQNRYNETDGFDGMIHTEVQSERRIVICRYSLRKIMTP